jgi:hypothetical protein
LTVCDAIVTHLHRLALIGHPVRVPAADPRPRRGARLPALLAVAVLALTAGTGCGGLDDRGSALDRTDVVTDLATQLERSASLTYAADYQLTGGRTARVVQSQSPPRAAYVYPGGMIAVTAEATTRCSAETKPLTCTKTAPPAPTAAIRGAEPTDAGRNGMVTPSVVLKLLTATALDSDAIIDQHDTTIAGRHATCVVVMNVDALAARFDACVTTEGVLGSFTGTVDGTPVELAMTRFSDTTDGVTFDPPAGAKVIDRR